MQVSILINTWQIKPHLSICIKKMLPATDIKEGFLEKTFLSPSAEEFIGELGRQMRKGDVA